MTTAAMIARRTRTTRTARMVRMTRAMMMARTTRTTRTARMVRTTRAALTARTTRITVETMGMGVTGTAGEMGAVREVNDGRVRRGGEGGSGR